MFWSEDPLLDFLVILETRCRLTLDICRTSVRFGIDAQAWVTHTHKLSYTSSLCFTAIVTGLNISFDLQSYSPLVLLFKYLIDVQSPDKLHPHRERHKVRVKISFGVIA